MVHLIGDYYMSADRYSYTVGTAGKGTANGFYWTM